MKLGLSNIAWNMENDHEIYTLMKQHGFNGLEIAPTRFFQTSPYDAKDKELTLVLEDINKYDLMMISMQSLLFGKPEYKLFGSFEERENLKNYLKKAMDFAYKLKIKNLVFGNPKNRVIRKEDKEEDVYEFFNELGDYAIRKEMCLSIEANPKEYGTNFLNTTKEAFDFVNAVNNNGIKLQLDLGTVILNNEKIDDIDLMIDKINHIHISEPYLEIISNENVILHKRLFEILKKNNYDNWISVEMKNSEISSIERVLKYVESL